MLKFEKIISYCITVHMFYENIQRNSTSLLRFPEHEQYGDRSVQDTLVDIVSRAGTAIMQ